MEGGGGGVVPEGLGGEVGPGGGGEHLVEEVVVGGRSVEVRRWRRHVGITVIVIILLVEVGERNMRGV